MVASIHDNPRGRQATEVTAVFTTIATIVVALRLYTRIFLIRCAGIEDFGIALAMLSSIGLTICIGVQAKYGMGVHFNTLQPDELQSVMKAFWCSLTAYYLALGLTKGSILLQYRRIFTTKRFQITNWITMAVVVSYTIWTVFSSIFACVPVRAFWTREKARCINQFAMWFTNAGINILTDFAIILLPIPVIRSLKLGHRQKMGLIGIFAVGGAVCIVSILRLHSLVSISNSSDPTYDNPGAATWSSVEANVAIICSCLPLLRPLLARWIPTAFPSHKRSANSGHRHPLTHGSRGGARTLRTNEFVLDADIQVETTIHVSVEDDERSTGWKTPPSSKDWVECASAETVKRATSSEHLVEEHGKANR